MLQCIMSVERAAKCGPLFEFTPEFYIDAAINAFHGLRLYFHPTVNFTQLPGTLDYISLIIRYSCYIYGSCYLFIIIITVRIIYL